MILLAFYDPRNMYLFMVYGIVFVMAFWYNVVANKSFSEISPLTQSQCFFQLL